MKVDDLHPQARCGEAREELTELLTKKLKIMKEAESEVVNVENWNDGEYEPIRSKSGKLYQFYEKVNPETGEKAYQVAEYLYDGNYISEECFKKVLNA